MTSLERAHSLQASNARGRDAHHKHAPPLAFIRAGPAARAIRRRARVTTKLGRDQAISKRGGIRRRRQRAKRDKGRGAEAKSPEPSAPLAELVRGAAQLGVCAGARHRLRLLDGLCELSDESRHAAFYQPAARLWQEDEADLKAGEEERAAGDRKGR